MNTNNTKTLRRLPFVVGRNSGLDNNDLKAERLRALLEAVEFNGSEYSTIRLSENRVLYHRLGTDQVKSVTVNKSGLEVEKGLSECSIQKASTGKHKYVNFSIPAGCGSDGISNIRTIKSSIAEHVLIAVMEGKFDSIQDLYSAQVNHINRNRRDNRPENLEVVTEDENRIHLWYTDLTGETISYKDITSKLRDYIPKNKTELKIKLEELGII